MPRVLSSETVRREARPVADSDDASDAALSCCEVAGEVACGLTCSVRSPSCDRPTSPSAQKKRPQGPSLEVAERKSVFGSGGGPAAAAPCVADARHDGEHGHSERRGLRSDADPG